MSKTVRKWLRPPEKVVEESVNKYASLDSFFLEEQDEGFFHYDISQDNSWENDVFAVALVNGVKEEKSFIKQDFSGITLAGAKLQGSILKSSIFINGNLVGVDFLGSDLEGVDFSACDLRKVDFRKCNLRNAIFKEANLAGAIFDDSDLSGANFTDSYVLGVKLGSAKIDEKSKSEFEKMQQLIEDAEKGLIPLHHLSNAQLRALDWRRMYLCGIDLSSLDLTGISFVGVNLSGTMQQIIAVPPTYDEEDEAENNDVKKAQDIEVNFTRPPEKPDESQETEHQAYEFMDMFEDSKLTNEDKPLDIENSTKKAPTSTSGDEEFEAKNITGFVSGISGALDMPESPVIQEPSVISDTPIMPRTKPEINPPPSKQEQVKPTLPSNKSKEVKKLSLEAKAPVKRSNQKESRVTKPRKGKLRV